MATPLMSLPDQSPGIAKYVVPWKSRKEFLKIYNDLYGEDEDLQQKAIKRITTWKSRAGSKLSVAVENTGALLESIINHKVALREQQVTEKENILRSSYSLAIVRFINLVTEKGQTKQTAQPVHTLAREFGIPDWMVRVRHDATHNALPSLEMLSSAAAWAVQYLKEEFWDCQTHDTTIIKKLNRTSSLELGNKIRETLCTFQNLRLKETKVKESNQNITAPEVQKLKAFVKENRFCFMKCLLEDGTLIPSDEDLDNFGLKREEILHQILPQLPTQFLDFWQPVIAMMYDAKVVETLVRVAIFSLNDEDCLRNYFLTGWLIFFLRNNPGPSKQKGPRRRKTKSNKAPLLPKKLLLSVCLENINKFTIHLLRYLMDRQALGEEAFTKLSDLLSFTPPSDDDDGTLDSGDEEQSDDAVYTVEDLKMASVGHSRDNSPSPDLESVQASVVDRGEGMVDWKVCTDIVDWSKIPFGILPFSFEEDEKTDEMEAPREIENSEDDGEDEVCDYSDDDNSPHARTWKRSCRKRPIEEVYSLPEERPSPKQSTYVVHDTELL